MIRRLKNEEIEFVMGIWKKENIRAHDFIIEDYWNSNYEKVKVLLPKAEIYVYEIENRIIGFIGLNQEYIEGIFVDANYHNKGIGTELIQKAKSIRNRLILKVYQKNLNAIQFYKKNEFKLVSTSLDKCTNEYEYIMEWVL